VHPFGSCDGLHWLVPCLNNFKVPARLSCEKWNIQFYLSFAQPTFLYICSSLFYLSSFLIYFSFYLSKFLFSFLLSSFFFSSNITLFITLLFFVYFNLFPFFLSFLSSKFPHFRPPSFYFLSCVLSSSFGQKMFFILYIMHVCL
jgi:hypothetical protein